MRFNWLVLILALVAPLFTLWLIDSQLKFVLYSFEVALILILYYLLSEKIISIKIKFENIGSTITKLDYAFLAISTMLLVFSIFKLYTVFTMVFAVIVSFFLPGYALLRLLNFRVIESWIEWPALSFALSIGLSSIIFTSTLPFSQLRALLLAAIYFAISLCPLIKNRFATKERVSLNYIGEFNLLETLLFLWIITFFFFAILMLYPQMSLRPGLDIVDHFSSMQLLLIAPDAYSSIYPWFHTTWACIYELSPINMEIFQTGLACVSGIIVFSFFVMAKAYLKNIDWRAPIIATSFFFVFAGFGWIYFLKEKLSMPELNAQLNILGISSDVSYMDVGYGQGSWLWLWFRPMTVSFALFFILLYLLSRRDIPRAKYITIFSFITTTLGFIHIPELIFFNVLLLFLILLLLKFQIPTLRLRDASIATLFGCVIYFLFALISGALGGFIKVPPIDTLIVLIGTASTSCILALKFNFQNKKVLVPKIIEVITFTIALLFIAGLTTWLASENPFSFRYVSETYYIPLIMYPVLLGIVGFLALHGIIVTLRTHRNNLAFVCIILFFFMIIFGKLISFVNVNFIDLGYGEKRFWPAMFAAASMLASISVSNQAVNLIHGKKKSYIAIIVTFMVIIGVTSTNLSIEYWNRPVNINNYTLEVIEYLSSPINRNVRTPILTASATAKSTAKYIPTPYVMDAYRYPVWESTYPEVPLLILYNKYYLPPYLYLENQDFNYILKYYINGFFTRYMLHLLPEVYKNEKAMVLKIPEGVPPSLDSKVALIIPDDNLTDYLFAYTMLSFGNYDYTVCLRSDIKTIMNKETIIIPRDNEDYFNLVKRLASQEEFQGKNKEIIVLNSNGYGSFSDLFFEPSDGNIKSSTIESFNFTLNLPIEVDAPILTGKNSVKILSWYSDGIKKVPFAAELTENERKLVYVNVYPLIKASLKEETIVDARQILNLLMSEVEDGKVKDASTYGNDGTIFGTKTSFSPFGMALDFDGKESYIEVPNSDELNIADKITIEAWIKPENPNDGFTIVSKKLSYGSKDGYVFLFDGGNFYFNFGNGSNYFPNAFAYGRLNANQWYHFAVSYDRCFIKYYVNGLEVGSVKQNETIAPNSLNLLIGKRQDDAWKLKGSVYKITIYHEALSASEIFESYNRTISKLWTKNPISSILGNLFKAAELNLPLHGSYESWVFEGNTAIFSYAILNGNVTIKSSSFASLKVDDFTNVTIITDNEQNAVSYVKEIYINETSVMEISATGAEIYPGKGFYAKIVLINPTLTLDGENNLIILITRDGEVKNIMFQNGKVKLIGCLTVYARTPTIQALGDMKFKKFYSLFSLRRSIISSGQDLNIKGVMEFRLTVSDAYSFASDLKWKGSLLRDPPRLQWNEYDSIKNMIPWLLISIILTLFCYAFFRRETLT